MNGSANILMYVHLPQSKEPGSVTTSFQLDPDAERRLDFVVAQSGRSKEFCLAEIVERGLEDLEDYYVAAEVLERVRSGKEQVYSGAEMMTALELDD